MALPLKSPKKQTKVQENISRFLDIISPTSLEFHSQQVTMGEQFQRVLVVIDYPPQVNAAWLARIAGLEGVICSIHAVPTGSDQLIDEITVSMGELQARMQNEGNQVVIQRSEEAYELAKALLKKIDQDQQSVFYITVVIVVTANDQTSLDKRVRRVSSALAASGMRGRPLMFRQEEALLSAGPWGILHKDVEEVGFRNVPSESLSAAFPFSFSGLNDGSGVLLGKDKSGGIVLLDIWKREGSRNNSNVTVTGSPGKGKSTTVKKIILNEYGRGSKVIYIDPERECKEMCEKIGGAWIDCGGGSRGRINPLQVRVVALDDDEEDEDRLFPDEVVKQGPLALHFQTLRTFFNLYLKGLTKIQLARLEEALEEVYRNFDITWNTDPSTIANDKWPIMKDLHEELLSRAEKDKDKWDDLATLIRSAAIGADSAIFGGHTTIKADSDFIVLDIHRLLESDQEIRSAQYFNVLGWAWNEISVNRWEEVILAIDEGYLLVDPEIPQAIMTVRNISKRIRKYSGGLMFITHNFVDLLHETVRRYGQALIDNPTYKVLMGQGDKEVEDLTKLMKLTEKEIEILTDGKQREAILVAGNRRLHIEVVADQFELELIGKGGGR